MDTATQKRLEDMQKEQDRYRFEHEARQFFRRWQPKNPQDAAEFSAELFALVGRIHADSMEPVRQLITDVMSTTAAMKLYGPK